MVNHAVLTHGEQMQIIREKQQQIAIFMQELNLDCWMIVVRESGTNPDPVQSLTIGGDVVWISTFIYYFKNTEFRTAAIVGNFDVNAEKEKKIWNEVIGYKEGISNILQDFFHQLDPHHIALNYSEDNVIADGLSHGLYRVISKILAPYVSRFQSAEKLVQKIRGIKTQTEITLIQQACNITQNINQTMTQLIEVGMTEVEIQQLFHQRMEEHQVAAAWQRDQCPMVDAGPNKELGHSGPLNTEITKEGHTLHNDFGVKYHGYCSDIQRMWYFGSENEIPEELLHAFNTVRDAIQFAADFLKPGVLGFQVDEIARNYVVAQGYEEYGHALGHQVGQAAHDGGTLLGPVWERYGDTVKGKVEVDNIFTLELHVKTAHYGTVSLEEMVRVTEDGCEFFLPPQKKLIVIS